MDELTRKVYEANIRELSKTSGRETTYIKEMLQNNILRPKIDGFQPHTNGWYYSTMITGTWAELIKGIQFNNPIEEFSSIETLDTVPQKFPYLIKDVLPVNKTLDFESISGRARNLYLNTKTSLTGDISIIWKDNNQLDNLKYHIAWEQTIDFMKKGYIKRPKNSISANPMFVDVPYYNALWVAVLEPFTLKLLGLHYFIGLAPTEVPIKEVIGERGSSQMTTYTINYKVVDGLTKYFDYNTPPSGTLYNKFMETFNT